MGDYFMLTSLEICAGAGGQALGLEKDIQYIPENSSELGAVYTPEILAEWVSSIVGSYFAKRKSFVVVDPACGTGALLRPFLKNCFGRVSLVGIDIDKKAVDIGNKKYGSLIQFKHFDSLQPQRSISLNKTWEANIGKKTDAIIANPPWGAIVTRSKKELLEEGFKTAQGQFDSYDLFFEMSLKVLPKGGVYAFIVPDSIFQSEHIPLRKILLQNSHIDLIARLGEGWFKGVCRGVVVIVGRKNSVTDASHKISCLRINENLRRAILAGEQSMMEICQKESHLVKQKVFSQDEFARFQIDVTDADRPIMEWIRNRGSTWVDWLESGRGVELSKHGWVVKCSNCGEVRPKPRKKESVICYSCKKRIPVEEQNLIKITDFRKSGPGKWAPFIVGEDIQRFFVTQKRFIRTDIDGINYKDFKQYQQPKLLIRKTGVGIKCALDNSGSLTNQVVYHYRLCADAPGFYLFYLLGVISSRLMTAYHLMRLGDNEWRSHPYLTQHQIATLPVPSIKNNCSKKWAQANAIADVTKQIYDSGTNDDKLDIYLECLVAGLFDLSKKSAHWAPKVILNASSLEPLRNLKVKRLSEVYPVKV